MVAPCIECLRIFRAPSVHPAILLCDGSASPPVLGHNGRLEMIGKSEDEMDLALWRGARKPLPGITRQPSRIGEVAHQVRPALPRSYLLHGGFPGPALRSPVSLSAHCTW